MSSEFDLIHRFFQRASRREDVIKGIGDDGALLRISPGVDLVVTTDTLVDGVHFPRDTNPESLGHKALAVNLSDLAAMAAEPAWVTLALSLPGADESWLAPFAQGLFKLAEQFDVALVGGDLTRGPLTITIQALGFVAHGQALGRDGAKPGDGVYITGSVGDAALGLAALQNRVVLDAPSLGLCLSRLHRPMPRVLAGLALRGLASAAIDVSDGMVADLEHVLAASGVGATLRLEQLPLSTTVRRALEEGQAGWEIPLAGGDDYELLFTVTGDRAERLREKIEATGCTVTQVGTIDAERGLRITRGGVPQALPQRAGYNHFAHNLG